MPVDIVFELIDLDEKTRIGEFRNKDEYATLRAQYPEAEIEIKISRGGTDSHVQLFKRARPDENTIFDFLDIVPKLTKEQQVCACYALQCLGWDLSSALHCNGLLSAAEGNTAEYVKRYALGYAFTGPMTLHLANFFDFEKYEKALIRTGRIDTYIFCGHSYCIVIDDPSRRAAEANVIRIMNRR